MTRQRTHKVRLELIWWAFTLLLVLTILMPVWLKAPDYPFFAENAFFIIVFVTFTRLVFLLPTTLIAHTKWLKVFVIAIAGILFFVMSTALSDFRNFIDERGLQTLVTHLHVTRQTRIINYIQNEMVFFGVGAIIAGIALPLRMIMSLWRMRNRGTV